MLTKNRIEIITKWIFDYCKKNNKSHLIIGISGGIDSALTLAILHVYNLNYCQCQCRM